VCYPVSRTKQVEPLTGLQVNEAATEMTWDNMTAGYSANAGTENVDLLPVPTGAEGSSQFWKPSMLLSASSTTQEPDAAAALIDFLVNDPEVGEIDRKSTRLNSSHVKISYAVFCLKKKKKKNKK